MGPPGSDLLTQCEHAGYSSSHLYFLLRHLSQACTARGRLRFRAVGPLRSVGEEAVAAGVVLKTSAVFIIDVAYLLAGWYQRVQSQGSTQMNDVDFEKIGTLWKKKKLTTHYCPEQLPVIAVFQVLSKLQHDLSLPSRFPTKHSFPANLNGNRCGEVAEKLRSRPLDTTL